MKTVQARTQQVLAVLACAGLIVIGLGATASSDVLINDIDNRVDIKYESVSIPAGGSTTVRYILRSGGVFLDEFNPVGDTNGCNARTHHTVTVVLDTGGPVSAMPSTFTFNDCGELDEDGYEDVVFTSDTPGKFDVTVGSITGGLDPAGDLKPLYNVETAGFTLTVKATAHGFYAPVDMGETLNIVKGGSTVPMKFEVFAGATEWTDPSVVRSFDVKALSCAIVEPEAVDPIEFTTTGGTSLRYDWTDGQFIQNWKTPTTSKCYQVTMTLVEDTTLVAYFQTR